jgi:hypothetical protein
MSLVGVPQGYSLTAKNESPASAGVLAQTRLDPSQYVADAGILRLVVCAGRVAKSGVTRVGRTNAV